MIIICLTSFQKSVYKKHTLEPVCVKYNVSLRTMLTAAGRKGININYIRHGQHNQVNVRKMTCFHSGKYTGKKLPTVATDTSGNHQVISQTTCKQNPNCLQTNCTDLMILTLIPVALEFITKC